jgi:hypothetical protein
LLFPDRSIQAMLDMMWSTGGFLGYPREFVDFFTTAAFDTELAATASKIPTRAVSQFTPNLDVLRFLDALLGPSEKHNTAFPQGFNQVTDRLDIKLSEEVTSIEYRCERREDQFWPNGPSAPDVFGTFTPERGAFSVWINMRKITGKPILMAWTSGDAARTIEMRDNEWIMNAAMLRLRDAFPGEIRDAINITVTRWNADVYARGSYSTFAQSTQLGDRAILREPVSNKRVLFAGEATVDTAFSQVTGAYASGIREADRIKAAY